MQTTTITIPIQTEYWQWQGFAIRYQSAGTQGSPILLVHGFGAAIEHWRKNIPALAGANRVYAIDLIGFGKSAKPQPNHPIAYTFETWGKQVIAFCQEIIGEPAFLVGNSIGCVVTLQTAVMATDWVRGVAMLDCSLRMLHDRKRVKLPWYQRFTVPLLQKMLAYKAIGHFFFDQVARPQTVRKILLQAYGRSTAVTDELVNYLLEPAYDPGAADVFLAFVGYSQGPLPEDLLPQLTCPVLMLWGTDDPWEPINLGRKLSQFPAVEDFIPLDGVGHCPQDEAPEQVNPILLDWITKHTAI